MSYADQLGYVFERGQPNDLIEYSILDRGYMFIVWIAQHLFSVATNQICDLVTDTFSHRELTLGNE